MQVQTVHDQVRHDVDPAVGHRQLPACQVKLQRAREGAHVDQLAQALDVTPHSQLGLVEERADELRVVKVNIDEEPELQQRYGILSIPTILLFQGGEPKAAAVGAQPKRMLERSRGLAEEAQAS